MQSGYTIGGMLTSTQPRVKVKKDKKKKSEKSKKRHQTIAEKNEVKILKKKQKSY